MIVCVKSYWTVYLIFKTHVWAICSMYYFCLVMVNMVMIEYMLFVMQNTHPDTYCDLNKCLNASWLKSNNSSEISDSVTFELPELDSVPSGSLHIYSLFQLLIVLVNFSFKPIKSCVSQFPVCKPLLTLYRGRDGLLSNCYCWSFPLP